MKKVKEKYVDKAYRLKNQSAPLAYMLASKHTRRSPLLYFDDDTGQNRPLRYAKNQKQYQDQIKCYKSFYIIILQTEKFLKK